MKATCFDGTIREIFPVVNRLEGVSKITISKETDFSDIEYIDFEYENSLAVTGDKGYFVLPDCVKRQSMLCYFRERQDTEYSSYGNTMPIFGVQTESKSFLAIVTGMAYDCSFVCGVKNGKYYIYPRFKVAGKTPYEDISVEYHYLPKENCDYSAMAREYRKYQLERGACIPLKERIKDNKILDYAKDAPIIRIRMGWKPAPPTVLEQTPETEPPMFVACDFDKVSTLLDEMKKAGVQKAEICLVGWNAKGHDGRWPSPFPVAEELGGEEKLKELIKKAESYGYLMDCHTNSTDSYRISPMFSEDNLIICDNGEISSGHGRWSGGKVYDLCPKIASEQANEILPKVRDLGFKGLHYVDVISIINPRNCASEKHPINKGEAVFYNQQIMKLSHDLFGGFSSEGVMDFAAKYLDYGLYIAIKNTDQPDICDKKVPLWQLVYHGIIMSNPNSLTVNYPIKSADTRLKVIEYGGRPTLYIHSKFMTADRENGGNWMGTVDLNCRNDEQIRETAQNILKAYKDCEEFSYLQTEFIEQHNEISNGVFETVYSNGTVVTVDYNDKTYAVSKKSQVDKFQIK